MICPKSPNRRKTPHFTVPVKHLNEQRRNAKSSSSIVLAESMLHSAQNYFTELVGSVSR